MTGDEKVVRHLEMIQDIINRLGRNSFLIKGASIVFVVTSQVLITVSGGLFLKYQMASVGITLLTIGFWILDGYYLRQNRLFRYHYDHVRKQNNTDFNMDVGIHKIRPYSRWGSAIFSVTCVIFYSIEIVFILFLPIMYLLAFS